MDGTNKSRRGTGSSVLDTDCSRSGSIMLLDPEGRLYLRFAANVYGWVSDRE